MLCYQAGRGGTSVTLVKSLHYSERDGENDTPCTDDGWPKVA